MKRKIILSVICVCMMAICWLPVTVSADSPPATLTVDGVLMGVYPSVQEAVDAVETTAGSNFLIEIAAGTVTDPLDILQQEDKNVVIRPQAGAVVTFTSTINIDGNGRLAGAETLLIQGLVFDLTGGSPENCIFFTLLPGRVGFSYPHNITINGCTFRGVFDVTVAVQSVPGGSRNLAIMNCTATDMHSLAQFKAVSGYAFVQNCVVRNASGGVNFYGTGDLIVDSCQFEVVDYAVRSGQSSGTISNDGSVTINNSILTNNSLSVGTVVLRGDSTSNVRIIHSDIKNNNANGPSIQNLNGASVNLYNLSIVETDRTGQIVGINPATITVIDDPNVKNGPVFLQSNGGGGGGLIWKILTIVFGIVIIVLQIVFLILLWLYLTLRRILFWKSNP